MLERTVASLESCKLQRILPQASAQVQKSHHKLRTGFWQHGALAIELSHSWPAIVEERQRERKKGPRSSEAVSKPIESELQASAFRLDFLYPNVQPDKARRGRLSTKKDAKAGTERERRRTYGTASDGPAEVPRNDHSGLSPGAESLEGQTEADQKHTDSFKGNIESLRQSISIEDGSGSKTQGPTAADDVHEAMSPTALQVEDEHSTQPTPNGNSSAEITSNMRTSNKAGLDELLTLEDPRGTRHLDVYDAYARLDPDDRRSYRARVMVALTKSRNIVARNRSEALVRQITEEEWTDDVLAAIVQIFMNRNERSVAIHYFKRGAQNLGLSGGFGPLIVDMVKTRFWPGALKIWQIWYETQTRKGSSESAVGVLQALSSLDKALPGLYFNFEQYLATDRDHELEINTLKSTNPAITVFRQYFAELALDRSSPKRAEVLLAFYQSSGLYNRYLEAMTLKWVRREIDRETAGQLCKIYENYRQLDEFKPSEALLQGMFEIYYPHRFDELNALHDDWCRVWGELSATAFNKYLKLHAKLGNVAATRELIERYSKAHPSMDKQKGALRLMAVYARQGDVKAVRYIMKSISEDGAQHFDRTIHRNLLMACAKAGEHEEALACFNRMGERGLLDSPDYAQMMHMRSRIGDLDGTLRYAALAQENNVDITPGMVLAMVIAFIGNDRLKDAERVVVEMADRGITSTTIWNELIKANGILGNLPRCYGILTVMKQRNVEYLPSTYEATLAAMIRYGQIAAATALLEDAAKHHIFSPTGEHYAMVMVGAVRQGDYGALPGLAKKMRAFSKSPSFASQVALLAAAVRTDKSPQKAKAVALNIIESLQVLTARRQKFVTSQKVEQAMASISGGDRTSTPGSAPESESNRDVLDVSPEGFRQATMKIGHAVALIIELRDKLTVEELISKFLELQPQKPGEPLPEKLMSSLMRAFYLDDDNRRVLDFWQKYWIQVLDCWVDRDTGLARPNKQYALVYLIDIVTRSLQNLQDGEELGKLVMRVYAAGFKMHSNNWNTVVKALAELGHIESAMSWCEIMLMPHWRGWQRFPDPNVHTPETNRFIRAINRANLDHHFTRPHQDTMLLLREKYMELRKLAAWSQDKAVLLGAIENGNPRLVYALGKTPPGFRRKEIKWMFGRGTSYENRLDEFIEKLTAEEVNAMISASKQLSRAKSFTNPKKLLKVLSEAMARIAPDQSQAERADLMKALLEPFPEQAEDDSDEITKYTTTEPLEPWDQNMLEEKVRKKLEADRQQGDAVMALRMERWRERTWKRDRWTRWGDQWAGWGDQMNARP